MAKEKTKNTGKSPRAGKKQPKRRPARRNPGAQDRRPRKPRPPVDPATVRIEAGKGSAERGGGPGGHYWHVYVGETRVGHVYINVLEEPPFGKHASIQIHINRTHRGRGIGSVAYRLACEQGSHDEVIATMRKSNTASQRAAAHAGFQVIEDARIAQLAMRWRRPQSG